jgi:hypothetical protein
MDSSGVGSGRFGGYRFDATKWVGIEDAATSNMEFIGVAFLGFKMCEAMSRFVQIRVAVTMGIMRWMYLWLAGGAAAGGT